jgi:SWI/SNF-related matrix-associated actin-dependent regulator of chromatin subfamily A member 5
MGANWVDPPRRERKRIVSYAENASRKEGSKPSGPRLTKMPNLPDHQFYDIDRITELYKKQENYERHLHSMQQRENTLRQQGASEDVVAKEIAPSDNDPQPLTEEEINERDELLTKGFSNWSRRDFNAFVRACERHGRDNLEAICKEIEGKTEQEIVEYAAAFKERGHKLSDADKIFKNIEKGEQRIQWQAAIMKAIATKLDKCKNPWQDLKLQYGPSKGKAYNEEEDRFLICMVHKLGYGAWEELKAEIRNSWRFRFDWFIKSRTPQELARRCDTLIRLIEKENEEDEEKVKAPGKKRGPKPKKVKEEGETGKKRRASDNLQAEEEDAKRIKEEDE